MTTSDPPTDAPRTLALSPSPKYRELIGQYEIMAEEGFAKGDGGSNAGGYARQEALRFRSDLKRLFADRQIRSVLDYGGGKGDWRVKATPEGPSLFEFTGIEDYRVFEPSIGRDERGARADCVVSFDVLEHVFIADVPYVLADIFALASKLVVLNIACYPANARLPNGENAHSTIRSPDWWRGVVHVVAAAHPDTVVALYLSTAYDLIEREAPFSASELSRGAGYSR